MTRMNGSHFTKFKFQVALFTDYMTVLRNWGKKITHEKEKMKQIGFSTKNTRRETIEKIHRKKSC